MDSRLQYYLTEQLSPSSSQCSWTFLCVAHVMRRASDALWMSTYPHDTSRGSAFQSPVRVGDWITVSVNGRPLETAWGSCHGKACVCGWEKCKRATIYCALVCTFPPLVVGAIVTDSAGLSGEDSGALTVGLVLLLLVLPCMLLACCHTYLRVSAQTAKLPQHSHRFKVERFEARKACLRVHKRGTDEEQDSDQLLEERTIMCAWYIILCVDALCCGAGMVTRSCSLLRRHRAHPEESLQTMRG